MCPPEADLRPKAEFITSSGRASDGLKILFRKRKDRVEIKKGQFYCPFLLLKEFSKRIYKEDDENNNQGVDCE